MKRKLLLLCGFFSFFVFETITAQEYEYLEITSGLNEDVIANGANTAAASTTTIVDNDSFAFVAADFQPTGSSIPPAYGLPVSGTITSAALAGLSFQLADYSENNSLRIHGTTPVPAVTTGTLVFSNQVNAKKLYVLVTSGSGASTVTAVINFTDATSQTITGSVIPDWYNSTVLPVAASGFGRVSVVTNALENPSGNPRMYQLLLNIDTENQVKEIESIQFTKTSTAQGVANIFAVTAELLGSCPSPEDLTAVSGITTGAVTWSESIIEPADGYDYYYSTSADAPTESTELTGNVASDVTTVEFSELEIGETYYFWVRSNCGAGDVGPWVSTTFTTGQISSEYDEGIINTLFNTTPNTASTTSCPGLLTVSVPDGYQIGAVATAYTMTTASNGYKSEQRSLLVCTTTNTTEAAVSSGVGSTGGTQAYNRTGLTFANGATGDVEFELRAWRTYGGSGCNNTWNFVDNNSWTVTVTYECITPLTPQAEDQSLCTGSTVADLFVEPDYENATIRWYDVETGGEPLADETALVAGTYYVSQYRYTCESERQAVVVTLAEPVLPVTEVTQSLCSGAVISDLYADAAANGTINWYATGDSPEVLNEEAMLETGSYFVSQTVEGCESERIEVAVTLNTTPVPTANAQAVCVGSEVGDLNVEGEENGTFNWYATGDSEEALNEDTVVEAGSYFVSQTIEGCESERVEVNVTISVTEVPTATTEQTYCNGAIIADLMATPAEGASLNWYATGDSPEPLNEETVLETESYFVSQTVEGCESDRVEVNVTLNATPDAPEGNAVQAFDAGDTVATLTIAVDESAVVNWYVMNEAEELVSIDAATVLVDGETYYVTQTLENCESETLAITVDEALSTAVFGTTTLKVYPNPANSVITVTNKGIIENIEVANLLGQKVVSQKVNAESTQLDVSALAAGTYILNVQLENGATKSVKIVKQ
ncbi:T9SS type A sorting domain-containing protein [Flavobacterium salilacus subsp. salilacus]|uniref:T9SS type A sorting domain-containing protein n=1 Tax=Flavobacterium TaxID=237 RepID=UPI001074AA23|nr:MULTISPECIES: T9SS type A sorting domain-containing protein [Flavobacterium]KAF2515841.1 T9SS type A sorting domain-containing protein [Flavobacterium salilacus subsp. salilacus]MBE1615354.1 T9SS type A sorting domain-containing protein [Flavobacterium sp. SaA2.13]